MINKASAEALKDRLGFTNAFGVSSTGNSGGLCLYWKEEGAVKHRHLVEDASCPWCQTEEESSWHAIFGCNRVKELWEESGCSRLIDGGSTQSMCELIIQWKKADARVRQRGAFLAWCIWNERNLKVFEGKTMPNDILLARVNRMVEEQDKYGKKIYSRPGVNNAPSPRTWKPPPERAIKINADASLAEEGWVGIELVQGKLKARPHRGENVPLWSSDP
ncbi:hypothetical protein POM88_006144 [Heracleum sosnowskyi]|uniref:Reverse transcriptase zinc-binding domain-containing protein n=1 Tax=Heracleum sosnowskyi TaxID=360622 RepID=A0AAD8J4X5_9APIA|nr:hypothetical protein POM88_006144 [Heracleum sosnowskyi]